MHRSNHRGLCTIAGFDPTGCAGRRVDLAVFEAFGVPGWAVTTAETDQGPTGVTAILPRQDVGEALAGVLSEYDPAALKAGMLATDATVATVAEVLARHPPRPFVVDPVLWAGAGGALLEEDAIDRLADRLGRHATLLTPNLPEAARLLGQTRIDEPQEAALALRAAGWSAVLLKGGHAADPADTITDVLATADGLTAFARPRVLGGNVRGTGCALAAAITGWLGRGLALPDAVRHAGDWLHALLEEAAARGERHLTPGAVPLPPTEASE